MSTASERKIIFLWSCPRTLSTIFQRAMVERGDLTAIHEPFAYVFYIAEKRAYIPHFHTDPNHPLLYEEVKSMIINKELEEKTKHIFVKDMCYHAIDHLERDPDMLTQYTHTLLIRDPVKVIASHFTMDNNVGLEAIGMEAQWRLFNKIQELTGKPPVIVDADDFQQQPHKLLKLYANAVGLATDVVKTTWNTGMLKIWETWLEWHLDAANTTGILPPTSRQRHRAVLNANPHLLDYLDYHLPFYQKLAEHRLAI
jgi:hypothetical protein